MSWPLKELGTNKLGSILTTVSEPEDKEIPLALQHCIFHSHWQQARTHHGMYTTSLLVT